MDGSDPERPRAKRARVAVACQRCKSRKQKCDGGHPSCSNCLSFAVQCVYVAPPNRQASKDQYLRALEQRVEELETALTTATRINAADGRSDTWERIDHVSTEYGQNTRSNTPTDQTRKSSRGLNSVQPVHCSTGPFYDPSNGMGNQQDSIESGSVGSVTDILRDLSIEASGGYIGASSNFAMGRVIGSLVKTKDPPSPSYLGDHPSPKSLYQPSSSTQTCYPDKDLLRNPNCDRLMLGYLKHISLRWPLIRTNSILGMHERRHNLTDGDAFGKVVLHLIYAIGGRFLETTGQPGVFYTEEYYAAALAHVDEVIGYQDLRSIQVLLLLSIHSLRAPKGPGAWTYVGLAMRLCVGLGLHRKQRRVARSLGDAELRKRIFWTAYCLDRQVSIILGRPFAISDRDIDAELPLDLNEDVTEPAALEQASKPSLPPYAQPVAHDKPSSMSCFIHITRLRIIESNIQQTIYRVDESGASETEVDRYLRQLEHWRSTMPHHGNCAPWPDDHNFDLDVPVADYDNLVRPHLCCQRIHENVCESQMVYYFKTLRFLLYPHLLTSDTANPVFVRKCVEACGGVCQTYKRLHQKVSVGFSLMALHSVFLAGLTLIYCVWISPKEVFSLKTSNDLNACSIVLYIITERWPAAKRYRDVFENVKQTVLEGIEESGFEQRKAMSSLKPTLQDSLRTMEGEEEGRRQFEAMMADMAGEQMCDSGTPIGGMASPLDNSQPFLIHADVPSSGISLDSLGHHWLLNLDSTSGVEAFADDEFGRGEMQFPME